MKRAAASVGWSVSEIARAALVIWWIAFAVIYMTGVGVIWAAVFAVPAIPVVIAVSAAAFAAGRKG